MTESIRVQRWLVFRNKYRNMFSLLLILIPVIGLCLFYVAESLSKGAFLAVMAASIIFGGNVVSFLYDEPLFIGGAVYSEDGTIGRYVQAAIELALFLFAQLLPLII